MSRFRSLLAALLTSATLTACSTPFAQDTGIDWRARPTVASISISKAKMYRREALINERRSDVAWLDQQLKDSETQVFKPEIVRELEQISAFATSVGLSFDPAAGLNYQRAAETGALQQEIATMRLQLQLDQLKRDAELVRAKFAEQTEPVNGDLGTLSNGAVTAPSSATAAAAADQLKLAVEKLITNLTNQLGNEAKAIGVAGTSVNPADTFRDRTALRDLYKSARNAASLDELHDLDGAALIRLNFDATVVPNPNLPRAPAVIQMKVRPPELSSDDKEAVYAGWLAHINESLNRPEGGGWKPDWRVLNSSASDNFERLTYAHGASSGCAGPALLAGSLPPAGCETLVLAVPRFVGTSAGEGAYQSFFDYLQSFMLPGWGGNDRSEAEDRSRDLDARRLLSDYQQQLNVGCGIDGLNPTTDEERAKVDALKRALLLARVRIAAGDGLNQAVWSAERLLLARGRAVPPSADLELIRIRSERAQLLIASYELLAGLGTERCSAQARAFAGSSWRPRRMIPPVFARILEGADAQISVYEVGPHQQVQQVSTIARSANSLALAVSLAASAPGSGAAANAAAGYSRQAMGKAAQLERLPALVGYANQHAQSFGWVIGPRATVDPKGRLDLQHNLEFKNLSVDMSVPGWWPRFDIVATTIWAPSAADIGAGTVPGPQQTIPVKMAPNSADYAALTAVVARGGLGSARQVRMTDISDLAVSACRASSLLIKGDNIWRATAVLIGSHKIGEKSIVVAPDMAGIMLDIPALDSVLGDSVTDQVPVLVLTPYGEARGTIRYQSKPTAGCKPDAAAKAKDGPSVSAVTPLVIRGPADVSFEVAGAKLAEVDAATLNGQRGKITHDTKGERLQVSFTAAQTASLPVSRSNKLILFKGNDSVDERMIEVTSAQGGQ